VTSPQRFPDERDEPEVRPDPSTVDHVVMLVRGADEGRLEAWLESQLTAGLTAETICLQVLTPVADRLGELWETDDCNFLEVTLALGRLQRAVRNLSRLLLAPGRPLTGTTPAVLLTCLPGEQHTLGLFMVAEFLVKDGFEVTIGQPLHAVDIGRTVEQGWFDVVGFSVSSELQLPELRREITRVRRSSRNREVEVVLGGALFRRDPALAATLDANRWAPDARAASDLLRSLVTSTH